MASWRGWICCREGERVRTEGWVRDALLQIIFEMCPFRKLSENLWLRIWVFSSFLVWFPCHAKHLAHPSWDYRTVSNRKSIKACTIKSKVTTLCIPLSFLKENLIHCALTSRGNTIQMCQMWTANPIRLHYLYLHNTCLFLSHWKKCCLAPRQKAKKIPENSFSLSPRQEQVHVSSSRLTNYPVSTLSWKIRDSFLVDSTGHIHTGYSIVCKCV